MLFQILFASDDMIVRAGLPDVFADLLIAKTLKGGHKTRHGGVLCRRDRRPRRSLSLHPKQNMNVVGHDHIALHGNVIVKSIELANVFVNDLSRVGQFDFRREIFGIGGSTVFRTVGDAGPYENIVRGIAEEAGFRTVGDAGPYMGWC